ncbi:tagatose-bisphosphate aldolase, partial [Acinetobacter baumannii]|nr:tagatose-bisphosphate aldolase [Acinetobacter baumannii]
MSNKQELLARLSDENGIISALAFDQRGALKRMMAQFQASEPEVRDIEQLKKLVSEELTP